MIASTPTPAAQLSRLSPEKRSSLAALTRTLKEYHQATQALSICLARIGKGEALSGNTAPARGILDDTQRLIPKVVEIQDKLIAQAFSFMKKYYRASDPYEIERVTPEIIGMNQKGLQTEAPTLPLTVIREKVAEAVEEAAPAVSIFQDDDELLSFAAEPDVNPTQAPKTKEKGALLISKQGEDYHCPDLGKVIGIILAQN